MRYEPVGYIYEIEIGALAIFLVVMLRYFSTRRFPNRRNRMFAIIMLSTVAHVGLDILSSIVINNIFEVPTITAYAINTLFYASSVFMLIQMMIYTYSLAGSITGARLKRLVPLYLPGVAILVMLIANPWTHWLFYIDPQEGYVHASLFLLIYGCGFIYSIFTLIIAFYERKVLRKDEFFMIVLFLAVVLLSTVTQLFVPELLITGVAVIFAVVLMFFTIQNPESLVDMTTGAFTYDAMLAFLHDRMLEHDRVQLVAVKVTNMSRINDLIGIENGSVLLRQLFRFLNENASDTWIFRMRGSCFVAITRKKEDYNAIRARIDKRIGEPWIVNYTELFVQATVCCVETEALLEGPITPEDAVNYIESAFDENEHKGGQIVNITVGHELLDKVKRRSDIETALRSALVSGEGLELYFQPLWSIKKERFVGAEVLMRFNHPVLGSIPPEEFVAIAENGGFITPLDEFSIRKTCEFVRDHEKIFDMGIETLEINLSALEFMHRRLPELLRGIMLEYKIDPRFLCFEITETAATESFELLSTCISEIIQFGCQFALDDFGTGYANISQVIQLPLSTVKLDKSMLYGPPAVLEDLARMFAHIDKKTVVEGVETEQQAETARAIGIDIIQGFYYARPMNGEDFYRFIVSNYNNYSVIGG